MGVGLGYAIAGARSDATPARGCTCCLPTCCHPGCCRCCSDAPFLECPAWLPALKPFPARAAPSCSGGDAAGAQRGGGGGGLCLWVQWHGGRNHLQASVCDLIKFLCMPALGLSPNRHRLCTGGDWWRESRLRYRRPPSLPRLKWGLPSALPALPQQRAGAAKGTASGSGARAGGARSNVGVPRGATFPLPLPASACRYNLPVCVLVMNNGGIYGGDRREAALREAAQKGALAVGPGAWAASAAAGGARTRQLPAASSSPAADVCVCVRATRLLDTTHPLPSPPAAAGLAAGGWPADPPPTAFVPEARYHLLAEAFGGSGVQVATAEELQVRFIRLCDLWGGAAVLEA